MALVLLAGAGWWLARGPAVVREAAVPPPAIDIDSPAMRARRDAAIALATMPDDPWSFAESLAASATVPAKAGDKAQCGLEDAPQFSSPGTDGEMPVQTRAASTRFASAQARIDAALRSSADPLDRAVADLLNAGDMRSAPGADAAVVQQAVATTDPRLYALGYGLCHSMRAVAPGCGQISAAQWARIDAGNGIPWVYLLADARAARDAGGVRDAMTHLASSSRFDVYFNSVAGAVAARVPEDTADLAAANDLVTRAIGVAVALPIPGFQPLVQVCQNHAGGDAPLEQQCRAISDAMFEHSDTLISQSISGLLLWRMTGDASRRDAIRVERAVLLADAGPTNGFSPCRYMRNVIETQLRAARIGEVEALRERAHKSAAP